jgi:hypothetical protein
MSPKKTLPEREYELRLLLGSPAGREQLEHLTSRYSAAGGKLSAFSPLTWQSAPLTRHTVLWPAAYRPSGTSLAAKWVAGLPQPSNKRARLR